MDSKGNSPAAELQFRGGAAGRAGASRTPPEPDGEGVRILGALRLALKAVPGRGHRAAQAEVGDAALLSLDKFMNRYAEWLSPPLSAFCARCEGRRGHRVSAFVHVRTVGVLKRLFMIQERICILCHVRPRCMRRLHRVSCGGARVADQAFASCRSRTRPRNGRAGRRA